jgi:LDH2 family malate/lactate/ureidoglycolate dehydrogenase
MPEAAGDQTSVRPLAELRPQLVAAIARGGYTETEAGLILQEFVEAEILDMPDYGLGFLPRFLELDGAKARGDARLTTTGAVTRLDAGGRCVHVFEPALMDALAAGATGHGVHAASVRNCTSWVRGGTATYRLARRGLVGLSLMFTNIKVSMVPGMAAPGLGINVLSVAVPSAGTPFVYDVALAAMPVRKLEAARRRGDPAYPYAIGVDAAGAATREPGRVRSPMPLAAERGLGLTLAAQLLAGAMLGFEEIATPERYTADNGILLIAIDPGAFGDAGAFEARVERWLGELAPGPDAVVHVPGEKYRRLERGDLEQLAVSVHPRTLHSLEVHVSP